MFPTRQQANQHDKSAAAINGRPWIKDSHQDALILMGAKMKWFIVENP